MNFWDQLFPQGPSNEALPVALRLLRKKGRPFLLLPRRAPTAARCLELYPAQSARARTAKLLLRWMLRLAMPIGAESIPLTLCSSDPFVRFLASTANHPAGAIPEFGVLAGNPGSDGQRFVILLFDMHSQPVAVIKAGLSASARSLIQKEKAFLFTSHGAAAGIPRLRAEFESSQLNALGLDFVPGNSPEPGDESALPMILSSWVNMDRKLALRDAPDWQLFEAANPSFAGGGVNLGQLRECLVQTVIQHGDLAPWNIKVSRDGLWTILDWERGQSDGIPAWDWFHYIIQTGILVQKASIEALVERVERLLVSAPFLEYAHKTGLSGVEKPLVLVYLAYMVSVIRPGEGLIESRSLLDALSKRWA